MSQDSLERMEGAVPEPTGTITKLLKEHRTFLIGLGISIALLGSLMTMQQCQAKALQLAPHWLIVALIPVLFSVFVGGYIQKFKGFGIELEAKLDEPIGATNLPVSQVARQIEGATKASLSELRTRLQDEVDSTGRLTFLEGRTNYYAGPAITQYLKILTELEFIEIQESHGAFLCLIPIDAFMVDGEVDTAAVRTLVKSIEESTVASTFRTDAIEDRILQSATIFETAEKMRTMEWDVCPIVDSEGRFQGLVYEEDLNRAIVEDVLVAKKARS